MDYVLYYPVSVMDSILPPYVSTKDSISSLFEITLTTFPKRGTENILKSSAHKKFKLVVFQFKKILAECFGNNWALVDSGACYDKEFFLVLMEMKKLYVINLEGLRHI